MTDHQLRLTRHWREGDRRYQAGFCSCGEELTGYTTQLSDRAAVSNLQDKHRRHAARQRPVIHSLIKERHPITLCYRSRTHCLWHDADEPDGEWSCLECRHSFARRPPDVDDPGRLWSCAFCTHSLSDGRQRGESVGSQPGS